MVGAQRWWRLNGSVGVGGDGSVGGGGDNFMRVED